MSEIKVGLIGCGGMGKSLAGQLITIEGVKLAAVADPFDENRESAAAEYGAVGFADYEELIRTAGIDAVVVAVPNHLHAPATISAAAAGKHVFCEKPMALTLTDCRAMIDACNSAGVKLQIGQVLRYLADFHKAIEMKDEGKLGDPRHGMIFRYSAPKPNWGGTWRDNVSQVGHHIFEVSVHEIDFARCIFGKPVAVVGWDFPLDADSPLWSQAITAAIEFESGAVCLLVEGMFNPMGRSEVEITGTEGALRFSWGKDFSYKAQGSEETVEYSREEIGEGVEDGRRRELREWIEAIANDTPPTIPGEEGMANIELALAILKAAQTKSRVALPLNE